MKKSKNTIVREPEKQNSEADDSRIEIEDSNLCEEMKKSNIISNSRIAGTKLPMSPLNKRPLGINMASLLQEKILELESGDVDPAHAT